MDARAVVAIILAIGLVLTILSGTPFRYIWSAPSEPQSSPEILAMWKDLILVIIGVLAGYITGSNKP